MPRVEDLAGGPVLVSGRSSAENLTGDWRTLVPVIDPGRCTGCLLCWKFCPEACIALTDKVPAIDMRYCKGCGICAAECPPKCIAMEAEVEKGVAA